MAPLSYLLPAGAWVVLTFMVLECLRWRRGALMISRRRFGLRMAAGGLLVVLLAAIFVGRFVLVLTSPVGPRGGLFWGWWLSCLLVALALMYLASVDMNEVDAARTASERKLWGDFARGVVSRDERPEDTPKQDS